MDIKQTCTLFNIYYSHYSQYTQLLTALSPSAAPQKDPEPSAPSTTEEALMITKSPLSPHKTAPKPSSPTTFTADPLLVSMAAKSHKPMLIKMIKSIAITVNKVKHSCKP